MGEIEDRLQRLAADRAAQVAPFSASAPSELAARRRATRRRPVLVAMAASVAAAVVIGGLVLPLNRDDSRSVQTPAGPTSEQVPAGGCVGKAYVNNQADDTVSVITMATGAVSAPIA